MLKAMDQYDIIKFLGIPRNEWNREIAVPSIGMTDGTSIDILVRSAAFWTPRHILEIGTNEGHTARALALNCPRSTVWTMDVERKNGDFTDPPNVVRLIRDSRLPESYADLPRFNYVFIDGDHSANAVLLDSANAIARTATAALLFWHDYHTQPGCGVVPALKYLGDLGYDVWHLKGSWLGFMQKTTETAE